MRVSNPDINKETYYISDFNSLCKFVASFKVFVTTDVL